MFKQIRYLSLAALALVAVVVLAFAACGDDDDGGDSGDLTAIQASIDEIRHSQQKTSVLTTMTTIRSEGMHDFNIEINEASEIEAGWGGKAARLHRAIQGTDWPDELQEQGAELQAAFAAFTQALADEDLQATKGTSTEAHDAWHGIENAAYGFVAGEEVTDDHGDDGHADDSDDDHSDDDMEDMEHADESDEHSQSMSHEPLVLTASDTVPTLNIEVTADAVGGYNLHLIATNFTFAPEHASSDHVDGEGHAHLYVDGVKLGRIYSEWYHMQLEPGDHEVRVTLNANNHSDLVFDSQVIEDTQIVHA